MNKECCTKHSGGGGQGAGTRENRGGRWAGGDEVECRSHVRAGGGRRMRDIKFFNDFLVLV